MASQGGCGFRHWTRKILTKEPVLAWRLGLCLRSLTRGSSVDQAPLGAAVSCSASGFGPHGHLRGCRVTMRDDGILCILFSHFIKTEPSTIVSFPERLLSPSMMCVWFISVSMGRQFGVWFWVFNCFLFAFKISPSVRVFSANGEGIVFASEGRKKGLRCG